MKKSFLFATAAFLAFAGAAQAQDRHEDHGGGHAGGPGMHAPGGGGHNGGGHNGVGPGMAPHAMHTPPGAAAQPHAPAPQAPAANAMRGPNHQSDHQFGHQSGRQPDRHDGGGGYRGNDNHPGPGDNNAMRGPDRRGPGGYNRPDRGRGGHDFSGFRNYHQAFRAGQRFHAGAYRRPSGWYSRRWSYGQILPSLFWSEQYWLNDWAGYDLPPPPAGAVWVRNGDDAMLIDRYSGEIITVEYDVFY